MNVVCTENVYKNVKIVHKRRWPEIQKHGFVHYPTVFIECDLEKVERDLKSSRDAVSFFFAQTFLGSVPFGIGDILARLIRIGVIVVVVAKRFKIVAVDTQVVKNAACKDKLCHPIDRLKLELLELSKSLLPKAN